ncbi:MAG: dihydrodipicolinate synthase family protein [Eggerthella lenta]
MTDSPFRGVIPPVVIPLTEKRQLDLEALERSINRMIDAGVDGLFFLGSSGEVAFLTDAQRYHVLQEAIAMVHGRVPVLTGIIDMETMRVVDQAKRATGYGVDALVATAPFYALGGPKEVERHFRAIREHTDLPLFAYDLPACVHTKLDPTMLVRLGEDGVLQGVKDSSGDDVVPLAVPAERGRRPPAASADRLGGRGRRLPAVPTARFRVWRTSIRQATWSSGAPRKPATGSACARSRITSHALCTSRAR